MRKFLGLALFISSNLIAQTKGVVKDSLSGNPIPYVSVWVENEKIETTSEENGEFSINVNDKNKNLIFSALGFESKKISVANSKIILLKPKTLDLDEVVVTNRKGTDEIVIGDYSGIDLDIKLSTTGYYEKSIWGKIIRSNKTIQKHPFLKLIEFHTVSSLENVKMRIRFFNLDEDGIMVNNFEEDIIVDIEKGTKKNIVDLTNYKIVIPTEGIIVGLENLMIEQNLKKENDTTLDQKGFKNAAMYEPSVLGFSSNYGNLLQLNQQGSLNWSSNFVELALKLTLTN